MSIFKCSLCAEKNAHIESLQRQIQTLEKLVFPPRPTQDISVEEIESPDQVIIPENPIEAEAARIFAGDFGHLPDHEGF